MANDTIESEKFKLLAEGLTAGCAAGIHDTTPGNIFRGAWGAARDLGFYDGGLRQKGFTIGYTSEIKDDVVTDKDGMVIIDKDAHPLGSDKWAD
jgi:hypothetical protein